MLFLVFRIGDARYALDVAHIVEVLPPLHIQRPSASAAGVAGFCNYRGKPVHVLDLSELLTGEAAPDLLSTRMLLVKASAGEQLLALLVPGATDTKRLNPAEFVHTGVESSHGDWLGPVLPHASGLFQRVQLEGLFARAGFVGAAARGANA
jgi:chemotaxis-related protein WspB